MFARGCFEFDHVLSALRLSVPTEYVFRAWDLVNKTVPFSLREGLWFLLSSRKSHPGLGLDHPTSSYMRRDSFLYLLGFFKAFWP